MLFQPDVNGTCTHLIVILGTFRYDPSPALRWLHVKNTEAITNKNRSYTDVYTNVYTFTVFDDKKCLLGTALNTYFRSAIFAIRYQAQRSKLDFCQENSA
jgi:hypothetical protein